MLATHPTSLRIGDWRVDPSLNQIARSGQAIKLEPRAMRVLLCLAEHAGEVVTVDQLLATVWKDLVVTSDSVYQAVASLRRALGDDSKEPIYIANVMRRGYRLVAPVEPWVEAQNSAPTERARSGARSLSAGVRLGWSIALACTLAAIIAVIPAIHTNRPSSSVAGSNAVGRTAARNKSIAVLPFVDMSEKKDQEYFADGLTEELIYLLSKAPGVYVPARTSSFYFKGKQTRVSEVSSALGVSHVLEGSVRTSGERVRVTVQLIRADANQPVWSETFDQQLTDIFRLQDEIANAVAQVLKISLLPDSGRRLLGPEGIDAYRLLLQARFYDYQLFTPESEQRAVEYYRQAVRLDPSSAQGWEGLSRAVVELPRFGGVSWHASREEALQAAQHALAIDPNLPAAHLALGKVKYIFDLDMPAARNEFNRARALDSRDAYGSLWAGLLVATLGRPDEALGIFQQGLLQDPLNYFLYTKVAVIQYRMRRYQDAVVAARHAVELSPQGSKGHFVLAQALLASGAGDAAVSEIERETYEGLREWGRARTYWLLGRRADSAAALQRLETSFAQNMAYGVAAVHALRGDTELALQWLDRAYDQRAELLVLDGGLLTDPDFQSVRADRRFGVLLHKIGIQSEPIPE